MTSTSAATRRSARGASPPTHATPLGPSSARPAGGRSLAAPGTVVALSVDVGTLVIRSSSSRPLPSPPEVSPRASATPSASSARAWT